MKIAIIGPTHPYKGGIAQHTTQLAHELTAKRHSVTLVSWRSQYPFFYPGAQYVPDNKPELEPFQPTRRVLSWKNPLSWLLWGRKLRKYDLVIFIWWIPTIQGPIYTTMLKMLGHRRPDVLAISHNVLPHEQKPGDIRLTRTFFKTVDAVLVHANKQHDLAKTLTTKPIITTPLPFTAAAIKKVPKKGTIPTHHLLFFGFVRPYKGIDILLKALHAVPDVELTIAGELWGGREHYDLLIDELGLEDRVTFTAGYVSTEALEELMRTSDAVVLPYKSGTATQNVALAHAYGLPVIATTAGSLGDLVHDGEDGLLCKPNDVQSLTHAIEMLYKPGILAHLYEHIPLIDGRKEWAAYSNAVLNAVTR